MSALLNVGSVLRPSVGTRYPPDTSMRTSSSSASRPSALPRAAASPGDASRAVGDSAGTKGGNRSHVFECSASQLGVRKPGELIFHCGDLTDHRLTN